MSNRPTALQSVYLSEADDGASISVPLSADVVVELAESPTTGYRWHVDSPGGLFVLVRDDFAPGRGGGAGAAGVRRLTFRATAAGRTSLALSLCREWEKERSPIKRFSVSVDIQP